MPRVCPLTCPTPCMTYLKFNTVNSFPSNCRLALTLTPHILIKVSSLGIEADRQGGKPTPSEWVWSMRLWDQWPQVVASRLASCFSGLRIFCTACTARRRTYRLFVFDRRALASANDGGFRSVTVRINHWRSRNPWQQHSFWKRCGNELRNRNIHNFIQCSAVFAFQARTCGFAQSFYFALLCFEAFQAFVWKQQYNTTATRCHGSWWKREANNNIPAYALLWYWAVTALWTYELWLCYHHAWWWWLTQGTLISSSLFNVYVLGLCFMPLQWCLVLNMYAEWMPAELWVWLQS